MTKTAVKEKTEIVVAPEAPAPAPQLPALAPARQELSSPTPAPPPRSERRQFGSRKIKKAIIAIGLEIGRIQKAGYNEFQKYKYTRWEDINEKLAPLLHEHGLIIFASEKSRNLIEENDKGSTLAVIYEYTLANEDDQLDPVEKTGYARLRDQKGITDDKAGLKAATSAYKQFCVHLFGIRTDDDNVIEGERRPLRVSDMRPLYEKFLKEITAINSLVELDQWKRDNLERVRGALRDMWLGYFNVAFDEKRKDLQGLIEYVDQDTGEVQNAAASPPTSPHAAAAPVTETSPTAPTVAGASFEEVANLAREAAKGGLHGYSLFWAKRSKSEQEFLDGMADEIHDIIKKATGGRK